MKQEKLLTKSFEIENARLIFNGPNSRKILIKKSQILALAKHDILYISSNNQINFSNNRGDVNLNSSCQLAQNDFLKCDVFLVNFVTNTIADLHPNLKALEQINTTVDAGVSFSFDKQKFQNVTFKAKANAGDFAFPEFFGEKLFFADFAVKGEYDDGLGILNLSEIKTDFRLHNDVEIAK